RAFFLISEPCEKIYCAWGATCIVSENGKGLCQCSTDCPLTSDPVCGSDDVTYTNHCHLRQASCQNRKNIRMKHKGACGECSIVIPHNARPSRKIVSLRRHDKAIKYRLHHLRNSFSYKFFSTLRQIFLDENIKSQIEKYVMSVS
ncbi:Agrin, partial [Trachymyrmex septentrionalis]